MNKVSFYNLTSSTSIITFSGEEASTFLQGQVTCDVLAIPQASSLLGALCNSKGRVISTFQLAKNNNDYLMLLPREMCDIVIKHLSKFIFRSKVNIQDSSDKFITFGSTTELPKEAEQVLTPTVRIPIAHKPNLVTIIYPAELLQSIQLNEHIHIEEQFEKWQQILTNACYPELSPATSELFIPQMLNLDYLNGISFKKGCYTGQEIIARMHYKGSVKRRLVSYKSTQQYQPGSDIHQLNIDNSIGTILSSHNDDNANFYGLAVLKVNAIQKGTLILSDNSKIFIQPAEYALD